MSLLKAEPPAPVRSPDELFALAHALEAEAATRYAELANQMEELNLPEVAAVFHHLVAEERGHAAHVEDWARGTIGTPPDPARIRWQPPETFDEEEARQIASSRLASAYRALSMAVRNEERAFALWTYIAAQAETPAIRAAAERMAGEELHHAALLRRARRHAYHAEREPVASAGRPSALARAAQAEAKLAAVLPALASGDEVLAPHSAELRRLGEAAAAMGREAAALAGDDRAAVPAGDAGQDRLQEVLRLSEQAAEAYLDAAEAGRDEDRVRRLQSLAKDAIARVAVLRRLTKMI
ncbi:ferritin-like domain-containing protein [Roseicella aerolata]|uniref:Ferritin family protein n=1 Tax=Roseicella aerolata TaxID=2883479 RepID=A0A9X1IID5_9PROT|nr:ferritin family protein [Roseicella aerolata]MCB4825062.1 ferritin family protein [Roseicella aerolata]